MSYISSDFEAISTVFAGSDSMDLVRFSHIRVHTQGNTENMAALLQNERVIKSTLKFLHKTHLTAFTLKAKIKNKLFDVIMVCIYSVSFSIQKAVVPELLLFSLNFSLTQ